MEGEELAELKESKDVLLTKIKGYDFFFENLVLDGGGVKLGGHIGVIKMFEEMGVMKRIRRVAGTSGGSIVATLVSVGMTSDEMIEYTSELDYDSAFKDATCGVMSFLCNIFQRYGWNPGDIMTSTLRHLVKKHTGDEYITFKQIYDKFDKELCVIATNVKTMSIEYFHPKTTPDVDVVEAVRCSIAIPGYMTPGRISSQGSTMEYLVDGGLVSNFPLHVFDGWYLSMDIEDSFFFKLGKNKDEQFLEFNSKTVGSLLLAHGEGEVQESAYYLRNDKIPKQRPETRLAKKYGPHVDDYQQDQISRQRIIDAGERLLEALRDFDLNRDSLITIDEFETALKQVKTDDLVILFGSDFEITMEEAFKIIDSDHSGKISIQDFFYFMSARGVHFRSAVDGGNNVPITTMLEFFGAVYGTVLNASRRQVMRNDDLYRTIGIDTDYITTTSFKLTKDDKEFLVKQGEVACITYLNELIDKKEAGTLPEIFDPVVQKKT